MKKRILALALLILPALAMTVKAQEAYKYNELYYQRASLFDMLPVSCDDIVFVGNSLTHGCEWHELFNMPNIKNRGINGDVIQGVRDRIDCVVAGHPKKIFLLSGANDVSHDLSADSIAGALLSLADYIKQKSPSTKLYLQSVLPINNSFGRYKKMAGKEQLIRDINKILVEAAPAHDFIFINAYDHFADEEGNLPAKYTNDGLHLMGPGYLHWRDLLLPYVRE